MMPRSCTLAAETAMTGYNNTDYLFTYIYVSATPLANYFKEETII